MSELQQRVDRFNNDRGWISFHNKRDLVLSIVEETGELAKEVAWPEAHAPDPAKQERIASEMADVLIYLVSLANHCDLDLGEAVVAKLAENEERFPKGPRPP